MSERDKERERERERERESGVVLLVITVFLRFDNDIFD